MYVLNFNPSYHALQSPDLSDKSSFSLRDLCPYMLQQIELKPHADLADRPVTSWQLAKQLQDCRKKLSTLKAFRLENLDAHKGSHRGPERIETFEGKDPGKLVLMTANLKRGLSDMILLQPIIRQQAKRLQKMGWKDKFSISVSSGFDDLFYGQKYFDRLLPEMPTFGEISKFDYHMEYGISLDRMKSLADISEWEEIDLHVELKLPAKAISAGKKRFASENPKIFLHWEAFDTHRTLPFDWFKPVVDQFKDCDFYCTLFGKQHQSGEIYENGPVNLWPEEKSILDLFITLKSMDVVVTTNTGIAHASAALGTPTIVIFSGRLYGWGDYWPKQHKSLYPTMHTIGLEENLKSTTKEIQKRIIEKVEMLIPEHELAAA